MARKKLGEILMEAGLIDAAGLRSALAEQARWGGQLGRILIDLRLVDELDLVNALSQQLHVPVIDLEQFDPGPEILALVAIETAVDHNVVPFRREGKFLDVAMTDAANLGIIDEIRIRTQLNIRPHLAGPRAVERALARWYRRGAGMLDPTLRLQAAVGSPAPRPEFTSREIELDLPRSRPNRPTEVNAEIQALQARITKLEALVTRDEDVLRKVLSLLIDKGVATREEILERLR